MQVSTIWKSGYVDWLNGALGKLTETEPMVICGGLGAAAPQVPKQGVGGPSWLLAVTPG